MESTQNKRRRCSALFIDAEEFAELLGTSARTIWAWEAAGKVPVPMRKGLRWTRWKRADVEAWIEEGMPDR